jgi:excisionase family DNA binding protein
MVAGATFGGPRPSCPGPDLPISYRNNSPYTWSAGARTAASSCHMTTRRRPRPLPPVAPRPVPKLSTLKSSAARPRPRPRWGAGRRLIKIGRFAETDKPTRAAVPQNLETALPPAGWHPRSPTVPRPRSPPASRRPCARSSLAPMSTPAAPSVTVRDAARRARVDERTVRRWLADGRLRATRGRHGWRIPNGALAPFLEPPADGPGRTAADMADTADGPPAAPSEAPPAVSAPSALDVALATVAAQRVELEARRREVQELHVLLERAQRLSLPAPSDDRVADSATLFRPRPWWSWRRWAWWR